MARPKGTKNIATPEVMWQLFLAYSKQVKLKPIKVVDWVGGMGKRIIRKKERPLTMEGFELYCMDKKIVNDLGDYFSNKDGRYSDFATICSRIKKSIREDQIGGGMAGIYNPSITQRLNNLVDKSSVQVTEQPLFPD